VLLKGCVNYTTQYLGSQTVKEIVGVSSTVEACRKMKVSYDENDDDGRGNDDDDDDNNDYDFQMELRITHR